MEFNKTDRGFAIAEFTDARGQTCSLQKSSRADDDHVWLGCDEINLKRFEPYKGWSDVKLEQDAPNGITHIANTRMELTRDMVRKLLPALQHFADTGELP